LLTDPSPKPVAVAASASSAEMTTTYCRPSTSTLSDPGPRSPANKSVSMLLAMVNSSGTVLSKAGPAKTSMGLRPTAGFLPRNWASRRKESASSPSSSMSRTRWPKVRTRVRQWGRFLEELPNTIREASFFSEKNSSELASSKGWIAFFLVNFLASGCRSEYRSASASCVTCEQVVPRRNRHVLGFSFSLGARFSRARLERALRGFLPGDFLSEEFLDHQDVSHLDLHLSQHICDWPCCPRWLMGGC
jgi:hypothetical protein